MHDMDDLGIFRPPPPDYFCEHPDHRWEAEKFEMDLDDIFTTLPRRFNMMAIPILDRDAFRLETSHIASTTNDRTEFFDMLKTRLEARRRELIDVMMRTLENLACDPNQIEDRRHWGHAMHIYRSKSLDAFARFFAGFLRDQTPSSDTAVSANNRQDESLTPRSEATSSSSSNTSNGVSCLSAEDPPRGPSSVSTTREKQTPSTAGEMITPRKRKRSSVTPGCIGLSKDNNEEIQRPAQKARLDEDTVKPGRMRLSRSPRRPSPRTVRRARQSQLPVPQPLSPSEVPRTTTVTPTAPPSPLRPQAAAHRADSNDSSKQRGNATSSQPANVGRGLQRVESCLAIPEKNEKKADMEAGQSIVHNDPSTDVRQGGGQHAPSAKRPLAQAHTRLPHSANPSASPPRKKPVSRHIPGPTGMISLGTIGSIDQLCPLPRFSRRTRPGEQAFFELDYKNKARPVMTATPRKVDGASRTPRP